ncbi:sensor histidine kinase [Cohnella phaseoli]|uniref:Two-component system sensor histidine kinase YesM n=1 Tax=Cohnella phaseoli TaxID=456490 RepID=A0A3D9IMK1_9BACL|nr:sensor histidine kinase [Cohnella phaseoli]RED62945.1 two-component system sensor histidine kinase YesM [Cohnella phaseoli]
MFKLTTFRKIVLLLFLLLLPILVLYSVSTNTSTEVVRKQIETTNLNQLTFLMNQLDTNIEQLSMFPVLLSYDPYIREFLDRRPPLEFDARNAEYRIIEKLSLQSVSNGWKNDLTVIIPREKRAISSNIFLLESDQDMTGPIYTRWTYSLEEAGGKTERYFVHEIGEPAKAERKEAAQAVFRVRFTTANMTAMLDAYKNGKNNDPFLYVPGEQPVLNGTSSAEKAEQLIGLLEGELDKEPETGQRLVELGGEQHLVSYVKSRQLGWYLVDYTPYQSVITPITEQRNFFYVIIGLLLVLAVGASFLLYRNVQRPLGKLIGSVQRIKRGDYSARIDYLAKNEFDYLIFQFNEMSDQIQLLIEDVYAEKLRSREATLKQLQSQINPHFLYNSLFFIINSAEMNDRQAVVEMSQNLAEYYRYATRVENQSVALEDELELVRNYLMIQNLRMGRVQFEIDVPEKMLDLELPRLILQPIVENAIVHGVEKSPEGGMITITGKQDDRYNMIFVQDDGPGMEPQRLRDLQAELAQPMSEEVGCGTWNVHRRLQYRFGGQSGLVFEQLPMGGLCVTIKWTRSDV